MFYVLLVCSPVIYTVGFLFFIIISHCKWLLHLGRGANKAEPLHFVFMSFEFAAKENYIAMGDNGIKISSPKVIKLNIVAIQVHFK